jgi:hypothetical protein
MRYLTMTLCAGLLAGAVLACGDSAMQSLGRLMMDAGRQLSDPTGRAAAQSGGCKQWQVTVFKPDESNDYCADSPCSVPAGWEPFSAHNNYSSSLWVRRCAGE